MTITEITQIISAVAFSSGAVFAWLTYINYNKNTLENTWLSMFRELYTDFWDSADAAAIRKAIFIDSDYKLLDEIIEKVLAGKGVIINSDEYARIEVLDRFCARFFLLLMVSDLRMGEKQRLMFISIVSFWTDQVSRRDSLARYIKREWAPLHIKIDEIRSYSKSKKLWL